MATIKSYSDLEQSKKLAEILPLESADMFYNEELDETYPKDIVDTKYPTVIREEQKHFLEEYGIPCWSLAALLGVIKEQGLVDLRFLQSTYDNRGNRLTNVWCCTFENIGTVSLDLYADNPVDACYELILKLNELNVL